MSAGPQKRTEHKRTPGDIEITRFELLRIFDGEAAEVELFERKYFCGTCHVPNRRLVNYRVMVTKLNDIALLGTCSGCHTIAARYIETGEDPEKVKRIRAVLRERKKR
ncbi:MAG: hypothetical protein IPJ87_02040 [Flavobacteriales bacterium]|nr:hypothetical protein [Flavobacteriales bacterium]MBK8950391.1 hypothetical protein [Flavobacteriales bacterium]MBK9700927.1 hypothetical protein [Flavobacteriales bacterium]